MSFKKLMYAANGWVSNTIHDIRADGVSGAKRAGRHLSAGGMVRFMKWLNRFTDSGECVFDRDWDLLIVLDACRVDAIRTVSNDYEFLDDIEEIRSVGSMSKEWLNRTFPPQSNEVLQETAYITANPFSNEVEDLPFGQLDEVWKYGWDSGIETIPPRVVTDRAIAVGRESDHERTIVHYMQPHSPYIGNRLGEGLDLDTGGPRESTALWRLRAGEIDRSELWDAYIDNLEYVLKDVQLLLNNFDAETAVISADHGEAMGEWGVYDHPSNVPLSVVRSVPWCETKSTDRKEHTPANYDTQEDTQIEDRLAALGYR